MRGPEEVERMRRPEEVGRMWAEEVGRKWVEVGQRMEEVEVELGQRGCGRQLQSCGFVQRERGPRRFCG